MKAKVTIQDIVDALGMENLLTSIDGDTPCNAIMSFYTDDKGKEAAVREIKGITYNSKEVGEDYLFVCKGANFKESYLDEAKARGAVCYVRETADAGGAAPDVCDTKDKPTHVFSECIEIDVREIRKAMPVIAKAYYGKADEAVKIVGITGTKGKSSTVYFMRSILDEYMNAIGGEKTAVCSGIENYDGVVSEESHLTTPEVMELYRHMDNAVRSGIKYMSIEVSSQALKYDRVAGISFEAGALLNIGSDHISPIEHPDLEDYLNSKLKLFAHCKKACYSLESEHQAEIKAASEICPYVITFSNKDERANVYAYNIRSEDGHAIFDVRVRDVEAYEDFDESLKMRTFGRVNVDNALAAIALSALLGIPKEHIINGLSKARVPGRMEVFKSSDGKRTVIVDYAHNGLSFDRFFESAETEYPGRKIISVFGSAGGKAYNRRAEMGESAGIHASYSIITEDDSGPEDVEDICREIAEHIKEVGGKCEIVPDRADAIKRAIDIMDDDTILFVAGRGTDSGMKRDGGIVEYPADSDIVEEYL